MSRRLRICFVGDSFTNGTGDSTYLGWAGRLCARAAADGHDVTYYNLGVRRATSADLVAQFELEVPPRLPATVDGRVVVCFGANDTAWEQGATRLSSATSLNSARCLLNACRQRWPLLWLGPPPMPDAEHDARVAELSRQFARLATELDVAYLDLYALLDGSNTWRAEQRAHDGAHPRTAGYAELAEHVARWAAWRAWFEPDPAFA